LQVRAFSENELLTVELSVRHLDSVPPLSLEMRPGRFTQNCRVLRHEGGYEVELTFRDNGSYTDLFCVAAYLDDIDESESRVAA
jgi:hypothetical protein